MKRDLVIAVIAIVTVAVVSYGLDAVRPDLPPTPSQPFKPGPKSGPITKKLAAGEKVVMRVNGEPITDREFDLFIQSAPAEMRPFYASPAGRRQLADELVKLKALEQEARRLGIMDDPEVRGQIDMATSQIAAARALEKIIGEKVDEKVAAEYEKEKGGSMTLRHILIAYQGGAVPPREGSALSAEAAMKKGERIAGQIRAGAPFEQMARSQSDDQQTAAEGGNLGAVRPEMLPPEIAPVVKDLKQGEISPPVKTQFGIHIFKADAPSLEELRPMLQQRVRQQAAAETLQRLQSAAKVDYDPVFFPGANQTPRATPPPGRSNPGG